MKIKLMKIDWIILSWIALFVLASVLYYKNIQQSTWHIFIFLIVWSALMMIKEVIKENEQKSKI